MRISAIRQGKSGEVSEGQSWSDGQSYSNPDNSNDPRWAAVVARDGKADGKFYYAVQSTGVYCRPGCPARQARVENVAFYATREAAERAGFRPCKRCRPERASAAAERTAKIAEICRMIERNIEGNLETSEQGPRLKELAAAAGMSVFHFHRAFKAATGVTPAAYAAAQRSNRVRASLSRGTSVTAALYEAGFNSNSRFYEKSDAMLGMKPREFRQGGAGMDIFYSVAPCVLGSVLVAMTEKGVCAIFPGRDASQLLGALKKQFPRATFWRSGKQYRELVGRVVASIEKPGMAEALPLDIRGTAFQQRVWQALREIPMGAKASYTQIAEKIGWPKAARAVARACAANPLAVAIPCHRVVRKDGVLSGYRWGAGRKRKLLEREDRCMHQRTAQGRRRSS